MRGLFAGLLALVIWLAPALHAADPATLVVAFQPQENPEKLQLDAAMMTEFLARELGQPVGLGRANAHPCRSGIAAPVPAGSVGSFNRPYVPSAGELISQGNLHKRPNVVELV